MLTPDKIAAFDKASGITTGAETQAPSRSDELASIAKKAQEDQKSQRPFGTIDTPVPTTFADFKKTPFGQYGKNYWSQITDVVNSAPDIFKKPDILPTDSPMKIISKVAATGGHEITKGFAKSVQAVFAPLTALGQTVVPMSEEDQKDPGFGGFAKAAGQGAVSGAPLGPAGAVGGGALGVLFHGLSVAENLLTNHPETKKFFEDHPQALEDFNNAITMALTLGVPALQSGKTQGPKDLLNTDVADYPKAVVDQYGKAIAPLGGMVQKGTEKAAELIQKGKDALGNKGQTMAADAEKEVWTSPTKSSVASYNKATDIYNNAAEKGHNIEETLTNNGIRISDNVEGGRFKTEDTAAQLRDNAGKMSSQLLRPALELADETVERTPVDEILNSTIKDIKNSRGETPGNIRTQIAQAQHEAEALTEKYPQGMSLTDMHDEKIGYSANGGYKPMGTVSDNNTGAMNRSFGRTLAGAVEAKAPEDIPVESFNAELAKQYQAADYLESLDSKKVPQGMASKVRGIVGGAVGSKLAESFGPGGMIGGFLLGKMFENTLEGMPANIRSYFLQNLQKTNPDVFSQVQQYFQQGLENQVLGEMPGEPVPNTSGDQNVKIPAGDLATDPAKENFKPGEIPQTTGTETFKQELINHRLKDMAARVYEKDPVVATKIKSLQLPDIKNPEQFANEVTSRLLEDPDYISASKEVKSLVGQGLRENMAELKNYHGQLSDEVMKRNILQPGTYEPEPIKEGMVIHHGIRSESGKGGMAGNGFYGTDVEDVANAFGRDYLSSDMAKAPINKTQSSLGKVSPKEIKVLNTHAELDTFAKEAVKATKIVDTDVAIPQYAKTQGIKIIDMRKIDPYYGISFLDKSVFKK